MTNDEISKKAELIGGIKNALEKGESLEKAKQSFLNAGYKKEEVEEAAREVAQHSAPVPSPTPATTINQSPQQGHNQSIPQPPSQKPAQQVLLKPSTQLPAEQQVSKKLMIILVIVSVLVLAGAAIFGIFWDKIFG